MADTVNWIDDAMEIFNKRNDVVVANPVWGNDYAMAKRESTAELNNFMWVMDFQINAIL